MRKAWVLLFGCFVGLWLGHGWVQENPSAPDANGIRWQEAKPGQKLLLSHDQIIRMKEVMAREEAELKPLREELNELQRQFKAREMSLARPQPEDQQEAQKQRRAV